MKFVLLFFLAGSFFSCGDQNAAVSSKVAKASIAQTSVDTSDLAIATFAGGCFWCTEAVFERTVGVIDVVSGYTGGKEQNPTYYQVGSGKTGHTEAIQIYYDSTAIDYPTLVKVFMGTHDPTQLNRQGPDVGTQYRSGIYYRNAVEEKIVRDYVAELESEGKYDQPIVTEVAAFTKFWLAEDYHQDYYEIPKNHTNPYVQRITKPKVIKFLKNYPELVKQEYAENK